MITRELTCIVCPMGCSLKVELDGKNVISVSGNTCKRGEIYAQTECTSPMRTLTTTAPVEGGGVVPVKTDKPIPKELLFECMGVINASKAPKDASIGFVVIENVLGTGANVITTAQLRSI